MQICYVGIELYFSFRIILGKQSFLTLWQHFTENVHKQHYIFTEHMKIILWQQPPVWALSIIQLSKKNYPALLHEALEIPQSICCLINTTSQLEKKKKKEKSFVAKQLEGEPVSDDKN